MHVDLQNIPACPIFFIKNETVTKHRQLFERGQPSFHEFSRCKRRLAVSLFPRHSERGAKIAVDGKVNVASLLQTRPETCAKNPNQSRARALLTGSLRIPVIMDEVKRVKIVVTDTTCDFYMGKRDR